MIIDKRLLAENKRQDELRKFNESIIDWLEKKPRECYFFGLNFSRDSRFQKLDLFPSNPVNQEQRFKIIKLFWNHYILDFYYIKDLYERVKKECDINIMNFPKPFAFLSNIIDEDRLWIINYTKERLQLEERALISCYTDDLLPIDIIFDSCSIEKTEKDDFLKKMNKAWYKYKERQSELKNNK